VDPKLKVRHKTGLVTVMTSQSEPVVLVRIRIQWLPYLID